MKHVFPNEVGSVHGLFNNELLCVPEGETGYFRKVLRQSSVQTEAASTHHHWVIYYVVQHNIYKLQVIQFGPSTTALSIIINALQNNILHVLRITIALTNIMQLFKFVCCSLPVSSMKLVKIMKEEMSSERKLYLTVRE